MIILELALIFLLVVMPPSREQCLAVCGGLLDLGVSEHSDHNAHCNRQNHRQRRVELEILHTG